jgi:hypothetical protein
MRYLGFPLTLLLFLSCVGRPVEQHRASQTTPTAAAAAATPIESVAVSAADAETRLGGRISLDVKVTPFSSYDAIFISQVQQRWCDLLDSSQFPARSGKVSTDFLLTYDGRITDVKVRENEVGEILGLIAQRAVLDPAPYDRWPDDMRRMIGSNNRSATLTFYYQPTKKSQNAAMSSAASRRDRLKQTVQERIEAMRSARSRAEREAAERRKSYVDSRPDLSERFRTNILAGMVLVGMAINDVHAAWGPPKRKSVSVYRFGVHETWTYGDTYLFFEDEKLSSWHQNQ